MKCLIVDDDATSRKLVEGIVEKIDFLDLVGVCSSAVEASNFLLNNQVDVIFLDIEMPDMTGLELADSVGEHTQVILISSKEEYAVDAFELDVTDYIVKPPAFNRFMKAASKAKEIYDSRTSSGEEESDFIFVKSGGTYLKLEISEINWIESLGDYVSIYTNDKRHVVNITMKETEEKLSKGNFCRIHRSYIVNLNKVEEIDNNTISIAGKALPVSRSHKKELMNKLKIF